nr:MAG TPA: hypothetical protein [Caudoviricetes sp.]
MQVDYNPLLFSALWLYFTFITSLYMCLCWHFALGLIS